MKEPLVYRTEQLKYEQRINQKYRNYKWVLYLSLGGITLMFLSLTFMYYVSYDRTLNQRLQLSPFFFINTFILLGSSMAIVIAQKHFREDNYKEYKNTILLITISAFLFLIGQCYACYDMIASGQNFKFNSASYLYIISGLHALHILGGLIFLSIFLLKSWETLSNYATSVVYFTDPVKKSQLNLFARFWHFLGVMWLYLLFFFIAVK